MSSASTCGPVQYALEVAQAVSLVSIPFPQLGFGGGQLLVPAAALSLCVSQGRLELSHRLVG